ncbi:MAG: HAD-IA family hydrolase [Candidatus Omnitrophota bacterium]
MKSVDLIIFDLDGTLVDSKKDIVSAVNFTLKSLGLREKSEGQIAAFIGTGVNDLIRKSLGKKAPVLMDKAVLVFEEYFTKHSTDNSALYPNTKETLKYFSDKRKAVVTNRKSKFAKIALKALGISSYFEDILGGDDSACMKPSSCPLNKTMLKLNVNKEKTIIVGDMPVDIQAGKEAGIATCGVTYGIGKRQDIIKAKPDFVIDDIIKLKNIIN